MYRAVTEVSAGLSRWAALGSLGFNSGVTGSVPRRLFTGGPIQSSSVGQEGAEGEPPGDSAWQSDRLEALNSESVTDRLRRLEERVDDTRFSLLRSAMESQAHAINQSQDNMWKALNFSMGAIGIALTIVGISATVFTRGQQQSSEARAEAARGPIEAESVSEPSERDEQASQDKP